MRARAGALVRAACLLVVLLPVVAARPASGQGCQAGMTLNACINALFVHWSYVPEEDVVYWSRAVAAAKWNATPSNCSKVRTAAKDAFRRSHLLGADTGPPHVAFVRGEFRDSVTMGIHWPINTNDGLVHIIGYDSTLVEDSVWATVKHEAGGHHMNAYPDSGASFTAYDAENCATRDKQKEKQLSGTGGAATPGTGGYWLWVPPEFKQHCWVTDDLKPCNPHCGGFTIECEWVKVSDGYWTWVP